MFTKIDIIKFLFQKSLFFSKNEDQFISDTQRLVNSLAFFSTAFFHRSLLTNSG